MLDLLPDPVSKATALSDCYLDPKTGIVRVGTRLRAGTTLVRSRKVTEDDLNSQTDDTRGLSSPGVAATVSNSVAPMSLDDSVLTPRFTTHTAGPELVSASFMRKFANGHPGAVVEVVSKRRDPWGRTHAAIVMAYIHELQRGDKFSCRSGQKGVCARTIPCGQIPWDRDGVMIEEMRGSGSLPARKTNSQLYEMFTGMFAVHYPGYVLATTGRPVGIIAPCDGEEEKRLVGDILNRRSGAPSLVSDREFDNCCGPSIRELLVQFNNPYMGWANEVDIENDTVVIIDKWMAQFDTVSSVEIRAIFRSLLFSFRHTTRLWTTDECRANLRVLFDSDKDTVKRVAQLWCTDVVNTLVAAYQMDYKKIAETKLDQIIVNHFSRVLASHDARIQQIRTTQKNRDKRGRLIARACFSAVVARAQKLQTRKMISDRIEQFGRIVGASDLEDPKRKALLYLMSQSTGHLHSSMTGAMTQSPVAIGILGTLRVDKLATSQLRTGDGAINTVNKQHIRSDANSNMSRIGIMEIDALGQHGVTRFRISLFTRDSFSMIVCACKGTAFYDRQHRFGMCLSCHRADRLNRVSNISYSLKLVGDQTTPLGSQIIFDTVDMRTISEAMVPGSSKATDKSTREVQQRKAVETINKEIDRRIWQLEY